VALTKVVKHVTLLFKDKMCKTIGAPSDGLRTTLIQCCLFCYLCYCLPNSTREIVL